MRKVGSRKIALCLAVMQCIQLLLPPAAHADDGSRQETLSNKAVSTRISEIDRALLLSLIKLARFNIHFHQEANRYHTWRTVGYALGREAGTSVSFASSLVDLRQRVRGLHSPTLIKRNSVFNTIDLALIGTAISGAASSSQLAQNTWMMWQARKKGYSPGDSLAFVKGIVESTDKLFSERETLSLSNFSGSERRVRELELFLLRRIRQQLLFEFQTWSCHSREKLWRENTFYAVDAAQNFTRMGGAITGLAAFKHSYLGGNAAVAAVVASSAATLNPLLSTLVGLSVRNYQRRKLELEFALDRPIVPSQEFLRELKLKLKLIQPDSGTENTDKLLEEMIFLGDKSQRFDLALDRETKEIENLRQIAQQQTIAGPAIGLTGLAASTLGTIAFYDFRKNRTTTNDLLFSGRLTAMSGQIAALTITPCTIIGGIVKSRKLKKQGELPEQLLTQRLKNLDSMEEQLTVDSSARPKIPNIDKN